MIAEAATEKANVATATAALTKYNAAASQYATDLAAYNTADANAITALGEQIGITNDIAANIFKADGIDIAAAESLFTAGTISQEQLSAIVAAAAAFNGSSFNQNTNSKTNTDTYGVDTKVGFLA